jgi:hypothetical protein
MSIHNQTLFLEKMSSSPKIPDTKFGKSLQPRRLWSDMTDDDEDVTPCEYNIDQTWKKAELTIDDLALIVEDAVQRCDVDMENPQTAFFLQTPGGVHVSILMTPGALIIHLTDPVKLDPVAEDSDSRDDKLHPTPPAKPSVPVEPENPYAALQEVQDDEEPAEQKDKEVEEDDGWSTVVKSKKPKAVDVKGDFYFFRDEANSAFIDFVEVLPSLKEVKHSAKYEKWSHAYCPSENLVYDYNRPGEGPRKPFEPNSAYLHKFNQWQETRDVPDQRKFVLFANSSTWSNWTLVASNLVGLAAVRKLVKKENRPWMHAYDADSKVIYDFVKDGYALIQRQSFADAAYYCKLDEAMKDHRSKK